MSRYLAECPGDIVNVCYGGGGGVCPGDIAKYPAGHLAKCLGHLAKSPGHLAKSPGHLAEYPGHLAINTTYAGHLTKSPEWTFRYRVNHQVI